MFYKLSMFRVTKSVLAAMFGVQSEANRRHDFQHGKPWHFIIGGILGTLAFIGLMLLWVTLMLS